MLADEINLVASTAAESLVAPPPRFSHVHPGVELVKEAVQAQFRSRNERELGIGHFITQGFLQSLSQNPEQFRFAEINNRIGVFAVRIQNAGHGFESGQHFPGARVRNARAEH